MTFAASWVTPFASAARCGGIGGFQKQGLEPRSVPGGGGGDAVLRGAQIAVGRHLHELADVDDEAVLGRGHVDPPVARLHLQPGLARLDEQQREDAGIAVRPDALGGVGRPGVLDELEQDRRRVEGRDEVVGSR